MSSTENNQRTAIEQPVNEVSVQNADEETPQYDRSSPNHIRSFSQDTLVSPDDYRLSRNNTQRTIREPERDQYSIQQTGIQPAVEDTIQYDEPPQQLNRSLSQRTIRPVGDYRETKSILRRPVPAPEQSGQYVPIQQTEAQPNERTLLYDELSTHSDKGERIITPFVCYGLALLVVFFASLGFWVQSRRTPIFFSRSASRWMFQNPKTTTMLWTSVAAFLAWCTLWLHACAVSLMARKLIIRGAKISTIECWVKLSNNGAMLDRRRPWLSIYTGIAAITAAVLTVGFAGLLTPVAMVRFNLLNGTEVDMSTAVFKTWYDNSTAANRPETGLGCKWYTHENRVNHEKYTFPTCPFRDDNSLVLQAGRAAVEEGFGLTTMTKVGNVNFNGTTGGTLPIGRNGFGAFDTVSYHMDGRGKVFPALYNYSSLLQGSTIKVSCEETDTSPITMTVIGTTNTTTPMRVNMHVRYNFISAETEGKCQWDYDQDFIVPEGGNLMTFMCGAEDKAPSPVPTDKRLPISPYYIFFRPFGDYETGARGLQLENITCKVEPRTTLNNVTYNSVTNLFTSSIVEEYDTPALMPTDFEAMDAVYQVFWYGISKQGNIVADTIVSLRHQNEDASSQTLAQTFENILKGFYEIELTSLRLYYSANYPPGAREVHGGHTHFRMGYNGPIEALYALGPLTLVVVMGLGYLLWGLWIGGGMFEFNPTRPSSILVASSQGGLSRLNLGRVGTTPDLLKYPDETTLHHIKVKFGELPHGILGLRLHDESEVPYSNRSSTDQRPNV